MNINERLGGGGGDEGTVDNVNDISNNSNKFNLDLRHVLSTKKMRL